MDKTKYNYRKRYTPTSTTESWDQLGYLSDPESDVIHPVDPTKNWELVTSFEYEDNLDNTVHVTKTTDYVELKPPVPEGTTASVSTDGVSYNYSFQRQVDPVDNFHPYTKANLVTGVFSDYLSGKLICKTDGNPGTWVYPKGVKGLLEETAPVTQMMVDYKALKEAGVGVSYYAPHVTVNIQVTATYDGDITEFEASTPQAVKDLAESETLYKPANRTTLGSFKGNAQKILMKGGYQYAGGSISAQVGGSAKKVLEGGSVKTKTQYQITKTWVWVFESDTEAKLPGVSEE